MSENNSSVSKSKGSKQGTTASGVSGATIILIEDEPVESKRYTKILEDLGAKVVLMESPEEMVEASPGIKIPALILTDICGPGRIDGIDLLRRLQQQPDWCRVPALVMTANPTAERVSGASELPVPPLAFLAKPVGAEKLSELVTDVLSDRSPVYVYRRLVRERKAVHMEASSKQRSLARTIPQLTEKLVAFEAQRKEAQTNQRRLSSALNRASHLSPELVEQLRLEGAEAHAALAQIVEDSKRVDSERTRRTEEKKRHAFQAAKDLELMDERIRSAYTLIQLEGKRKAA